MTTLALPNTAPLVAPSGYQAIDPHLTSHCARPPAAVYVLRPGERTPKLVCKPGGACGADEISAAGYVPGALLMVTHEGYVAMCEALLRHTPDMLTDARLSQADRFSLLLAAHANEAAGVVDMVKPIRMIELLKRVARHVHSVLSEGEVKPPNLLRAARYGPEWFAHAASVCLYSELIGVAMGVREKKDLRRLALGAMLHDIGLWRLHRAAGDMTRDERSEIEYQHASAGYEMLLDDQEIDRRQLMIVYQHHECPNGEGRPVGVLSDEIDPWAAWVKVVDAFDEMTTVKTDPYHRELSIARERLLDQAGENFNREAVRCWTQMMAGA